MPKNIKRVFRHYSEWEEARCGMWIRPIGSEREYHIQRCREFMADTELFRSAMFRAINEWPVSCEVNLTNGSNNRRAWIGHAACCMAIGCPEEPTRAAWWTLTQSQRDAADAAAEEAIREWERAYILTMQGDLLDGLQMQA